MGAQPPARGKAGKGACETPAALEFLDDVEKLCKLPFESSFSQTSLLGSCSKTPPSFGGPRSVAELTCKLQFDYCEYDIVYNMILVFYSYQFYDHLGDRPMV